MMKDFFGRELHVGDIVAFERPKYRELVLGTVMAFTPKGVRLQWTTHDDRTLAYMTPAVHVIKKECTDCAMKKPEEENDDDDDTRNLEEMIDKALDEIVFESDFTDIMYSSASEIASDFIEYDHDFKHDVAKDLIPHVQAYLDWYWSEGRPAS